MNIHEKLRERKRIAGSVPKLTPEQVAAIRTWFDQHPGQRYCYLFYDGSIEGEDGGLKCKIPVEDESRPLRRKQQTLKPAPGATIQRTEQLVSISTRGVPAVVSRGHSQIEETFGIPYGTKPPPDTST